MGGGGEKGAGAQATYCRQNCGGAYYDQQKSSLLSCEVGISTQAVGAGARFQQGQAVILLDQVVQFAPDILVETLEQKDVQLVETKASVKTQKRREGSNGREKREWDLVQI